MGYRYGVKELPKGYYDGRSLNADYDGRTDGQMAFGGQTEGRKGERKRWMIPPTLENWTVLLDSTVCLQA